MKHPALPAGTLPRRLPFFLAMEEWVARNLPADDYFFAWRVSPTVICGRNQDMQTEVDMAFCKAEGIDVVRRRSGGGCVYADMNNWMFSFITPSDDIDGSFRRYTSMVTDMLLSLGFDAEASGRNDIMIHGRKVAGNAFYHIPWRAIAHGTMLCDIDGPRIARAITPARAKIESKGVKSVHSHITSLKAEGLSMSVDELGPYAVSFLCRGNDIELGPDEVKAIESIEAGYYEPSFLYGRSRSAGAASGRLIRRKCRFEGVGDFDLCIGLDVASRIESLSLCGDFFVLADVDSRLLAPLKGCHYGRDALADVLGSLRPGAVIRGLGRDQLLSLLID